MGTYIYATCSYAHHDSLEVVFSMFLVLQLVEHVVMPLFAHHELTRTGSSLAATAGRQVRQWLRLACYSGVPSSLRGPQHT